MKFLRYCIMTLLRQMKVLIRKNALIRKRSLHFTLMEAFVPFFYTVFFTMMRLHMSSPNVVEPHEVKPTPFGFNSSTVVGYSPRSDATDRFMKDVERLLLTKPWFHKTASVHVLGFKSEFSMIQFVQKNRHFLNFAFVFDGVIYNSTTLPKNLHIILRLERPSHRLYKHTEFLHESVLLEVLMEAFINKCSGKKQNISVDYKTIQTVIEPRIDNFLINHVKWIALTIVGLTAYLVWRNVYLIAIEREQSILMLLEHMGMSPVAYWLSWFVTTFILMEATCLMFALLLLVNILNVKPVLKFSDSSLVFLYFTAYAFALTSYCILGSVLFHKAHTCSAVSCIAYVIATFPVLELSPDSSQTYLPSRIFLSVNLISAIMHIGEMEHQGIGFTWDFSRSQKRQEHYSSALFLCGSLYLFVAMIFYTAVVCGRPPWYILMGTSSCAAQAPYTETVRDGKTYGRIGLRVEKLSVASTWPLKDVTLIMFEDTVTVVIGHELSGKTTFMSVLKGQIRPTSGTVTVYGLDIVYNILAIKQLTGVCPREQTTIFPELTVFENLEFFATMKFLCQEKKMTNLSVLAREFEITTILSTPVSSLCASDKRWIQVATAFLGRNKVVLLEEPSLNMDIRTKYRLWNIIRKKAYGKTVVLCTNVVDEAELAGDRIAIFLDGRLKCCGTMQFINLFLGAGYHLEIDKTCFCDEHRIQYIVCNLIRNSALTDNREQSMTFWLPMTATEAFQSLFSLLYEYREELGIASFIVNATSLNDSVIDLSEPGYINKTPIIKAEMDPDLQMSASDSSLTNVKVKNKIGEMLKLIIKDNGSFDYGTPRLPPYIRRESMANDSMDENVPAERFLTLSILKSMAKDKYQGSDLLWSQAMALFNKKIILSTNALYIEVVQIIILFVLALCLASPMNERHCEIDECLQSPNFSTMFRTVVPISQGLNPNNISRELENIYRSLFDQKNVLFLNYDKILGNMTEVASFLKAEKMRAVLGARFSAYNEPFGLHGTAYYLPDDIEVGSAIIRSLTALMITFLRYVTGNNSYNINTSTQYQTVDFKSASENDRVVSEQIARRYSHHACILNAVTLLMIPYHVVIERKSGSKDVQLLGGASPQLYWFSNLLFDLVTYIFLCNVYFLTSAELDVVETSDLVAELIGLCAVNGLMMLTYIYVLQTFFDSPSTAVGFIMIFNYCLGNFSMSLFISISESVHHDLKPFLSWLCFLAPPHILPQAIYHLILSHRTTKFCNNYKAFCWEPQSAYHKSECCEELCRKDKKCLDDTVGYLPHYQRSLLMQNITMLVQTSFWLVVLFCIEFKPYRVWAKTAKNKRKTSIFAEIPMQPHEIHSESSTEIGTSTDVSKEEEHQPRRPTGSAISIQAGMNFGYSGNDDEICIELEDVSKVTAGVEEVAEISVKINDGDLFCFVGADIETPSTAVNMISGLDMQTAGRIIVRGKHFDLFGRPRVPHIGYCADRDTGIIPTMTGKESLVMFGRLHGVADIHLNRLVEIYLNAFRLDGVANKRSYKYSDCELHRLGIAAALIGEPDINLLCDPLYKLDSESKEVVWRWLSKLTNLKKTIVVASDNLREIGRHAACIMIIVNGRPFCVGTAQAIEAIYCKGYTLLAKIDPKSKVGSIKLFLSIMSEQLPNSQLFHGHKDILHFHIPYEEDYLANIFATVETIKKYVKVESYRVNRTNLDHVVTATQNMYIVYDLSSYLLKEEQIEQDQSPAESESG